MKVDGGSENIGFRGRRRSILNPLSTNSTRSKEKVSIWVSIGHGHFSLAKWSLKYNTIKAIRKAHTMASLSSLISLMTTIMSSFLADLKSIREVYDEKGGLFCYYSNVQYSNYSRKGQTAELEFYTVCNGIRIRISFRKGQQLFHG